MRRSGDRLRGQHLHRMMTDVRKVARDLLHDCDRCARYHTARRAFLDRSHRVMMAFVLISGSSAIGALNGAFGPEWKEVFNLTFIMLIPTVIGAIGAVWNISGAAREHEILARRFYAIASRINIEDASKEQIHEWRAEVFEVYGKDLNLYHALNAECYNAATKAIIRNPKKLMRVRWYHHLLRNWVRFSEKSFDLADNPLYRKNSPQFS